VTVIALLVACFMWLAGMRTCRLRDTGHRTPEYWWASAAFLFGGIGTLGSFGFFALTYTQSATLRLAPLVAIALVMTYHTLRTGHAFISQTGLALLFFFGIAFAGEGLAMPIASLLVYLPAIIVPKKGYDLGSLRAGAAAGTSLFLLFISGLCLTQPSVMLGPCRSADKCSSFGVALGAMSAGNALGMYLAAASAVALLGATSWRSFLLTLAGSLVLTELTASRSALAAWFVIVGLVVAYRLSQALRSLTPIRLATLAVCITAAAIPFMDWNASQLTYRPILWWYALSLIKENPLLGYGASYWVRDDNRFRSGRGFSLGLNYSTHNIVLELLISAGILGGLAFVAVLFLAVVNARCFATSTYTVALIGVFAALSLTEVTSAPGRIYLFDGIGIYMLMAASAVGGLAVKASSDSIQPKTASAGTVRYSA